MATSGTTAFNLDIPEIMEEAFELCGLKLRSGNDYRTARRSLNMLMLDFTVRGTHLWTIEESSFATVAGQATYTLDADTIDVVEAVVRTGTGTTQTDITMSRLSIPRYSNLPNKNVQGKPTQYMVNRPIGTPTMTLWQVPGSNSYTIQYWKVRRMEDASQGGDQQMDLPVRFINAVTFGLAYQIALKKPEASDRVEMLKGLFEEHYNKAANDDRDKAVTRIVPRL